ncbi:DUF3800 domain-containing protein [Martelella radicis]|uniref:DUF3800 domain-containing protein n=1 Tax=Martelella radicis TaxID=1397476 RepID=A0A7W6KN76_9HYPH|nr:DUF3800 domain-containing protein [Martelella radicis]MBB4124230.1 hypothetical protein [Martelella radicis]
MLVFVDESGDPGFKIARGSSEVFVIAMAIFHDLTEAQSASSLVRDAMIRNRVKPEWKFSKSSFDAKDDFFSSISEVDFFCRAIVVKKEIIRSDLLKKNPRKFYNFFTRLMCSHDGDILQNAKVVIDGSGDRRFKQELQSYMRKELPSGTIKKIEFKDSRKDPLVQLADMCAGAIARSYDGDKKESGRWRSMLSRSGHLHDVWDFK